ncbi:hypothetical protein D3C81_1460760 [compost metagenome]
MHQCLPVRQRTAEAAWLQTKQGFELGCPIVCATDQVDVEQPDVTGLLRQIQTIAGRAQPGFHRPALTDIAHRGAHADATPLQTGQVGKADFHGEQAAVLAHAAQIVQIAAHLPGSAAGNEPVA